MKEERNTREHSPKSGIVKPKKFACDQCDFVSESRSKRDMHRREEHPNEERFVSEKRSSKQRIFSCGRCDFVSESRSKRDIHRREHNPQPCCDICGKLYATDWYLKQHIRATHEGAKIYSCSQCDFTAWHPAALRTHQLKNHEKPQFICDLCGRRFPFKSHFQEHYVGVHQGGFKCEVSPFILNLFLLTL